MANRLLLCLVIVCLVTDYSICGRFSSRGSSSRSSSRGSSSRSSYGGSSSRSSYGGSSSRSHWGSSSAYKPSYSFGSSSSSHHYPSSSSGLSGSSSGGSHTYPSSLSGLSGLSGSSSGGSHTYPSSLSGLSGSGSHSNSWSPWSTGSKPTYSGSGYPPSSGLSGSGSGSKYPPSSGLSGSGSGSKYPPSSGLSGSGSGSKYHPSYGFSGSGSSSKYPPSPGLSGSGSGSIKYPSSNGYRPSYTNTPTGFGSGHTYNTHNYYSYASAPQHVYVTEYRNSNSRYSDLLTGLTLYNLGRSHNYHHHYYNDDYYTRRYYSGHNSYYSGDNSYYSNEKPKDEAYCTLRIKENNKLEVLKIPCEIVSTFTEDSKKLSPGTETQLVCVSNYTVVNNTHPAVNAINTSLLSNGTLLNNFSAPSSNKTTISEISPSNTTAYNNTIGVIPLSVISSTVNPVNVTTNATLPTSVNALSSSVELSNKTMGTPIALTTESTLATSNNTLNYNASTTPSSNITQQDVMSSSTMKPGNVTTNATLSNSVTSNVTITNSTKCVTTTDPLSVTGPPVNPTNMECEVEINTKEARLRTKVDCKILAEYSKMPEAPKKESSILPSRSKLKSWLSNPPWWMSIFIAV